MKRYLLFAGEKFHPKGGMNDLQTDADTVGELKKFYLDTNAKSLTDGSQYFNWCQIFDTQTREIVFKL